MGLHVACYIMARAGFGDDLRLKQKSSVQLRGLQVKEKTSGTPSTRSVRTNRHTKVI